MTPFDFMKCSNEFLITSGYVSPHPEGWMTTKVMAG